MTSDKKSVERIERERREREDALLLLLLLLANRARIFIAHSLRDGQGVPRLNLPGLLDAIKSAMADSWVRGYDTSGKLGGVDLVDPEAEHEETQEYERALGALSAQAADVSEKIKQAIADVATNAIANVDPDAHSKQVTAVNDAFVRAGWSNRSPSEIDPASTAKPGFAASYWATDTILSAYNGGFRDAMKTGAIAPKLFAYRHHSVVDNRTTDICLERHELTLPITHPYWRTNWPALHGRCRSIVLGVYHPTEFSDYLPEIPPAPGFGSIYSPI